MKHWILIGITLMTISVPGLAASVRAEEPTPQFQSTKEEFFKALQRPAEEGLRTKGLTPKGMNTKGPAAVVPDEYEKLVENPTARSLILFDFDSDRVKEESYPTLRNLAEVLLKELPDIRLVVVGHTDNVGTEEYNLELSRRRAQAVKDVLVSSFGVSAERFVLRWYGEQQPLIKENPADGQNRRVEFIAP